MAVALLILLVWLGIDMLDEDSRVEWAPGVEEDETVIVVDAPPASVDDGGRGGGGGAPVYVLAPLFGCIA